jgi:hypothetical protein
LGALEARSEWVSRRAVIGTLVASVVAGCGSPQMARPLAQGDEVVAYLNHSAFSLEARLQLGDLVDMRLFGDLQPGETIEQVRRRLGEPMTTRSDYRGTFYVYRLESHEVAVANLVASSTFGAWENWSPYAYPRDPSVEAVFRGELRDLLVKKRFVGELVVMARHGSLDERVGTEIVSGKAEEIRWYRVSN